MNDQNELNDTLELALEELDIYKSTVDRLPPELKVAFFVALGQELELRGMVTALESDTE